MRFFARVYNLVRGSLARWISGREFVDAVSLQAHTDQLEILADGAVTVISVNDSIEIKAKEKIVLQAGQAAVTLEGGDITAWVRPLLMQAARERVAKEQGERKRRR